MKCRFFEKKFPACRHVFCLACMGAHFSVRIREGQVNGLVCPQDKCDALAFPDEVCKKTTCFDLFSSKLI